MRKLVARASMVGTRGERCNIGKPAAHASVKAKADADTDASATTRTGTATRIQAAERLRNTAITGRASDDERTAPAASATPIHRAALLIQPYSLFCIVLVGELPTDFPDRTVGESQV
ncbi:hypothetical protein D5R55_00450 [Burkholderia cenocepacia]|uniref:Uncharacterized protein n=1 Tax=Burkholderia cenocepacia TaxID=95486 RepID=A0A3S9N1N1_9BURK|nr:hypothetical protein D5R55_00450 [Burkholderia cenocepacia]